jgi:hypothetical protein
LIAISEAAGMPEIQVRLSKHREAGTAIDHATIFTMRRSADDLAATDAH